jgi:FkbM family methyltransferase
MQNTSIGSTGFWSLAYRISHNRLAARIPSPVLKPLKWAVKHLLKLQPDPVVRTQIGARDLLIPWSHQLPTYLAQYPLYESEIARVAKHVHATDGGLCMIDVGANVGDTIIDLVNLPNSRFLCVEASRRFFDLLEANYEKDENVVPEFALLDDVAEASADRRLKISEIGGTAHLIEAKGDDRNTAANVTLDDLVRRREAFRRTNFLKVDTDGFDLKVLRGATKLLREAKPVLHIEFSPVHWREYGKCEIDDCLAFLAENGYETLLVYDNLGYLIGLDLASQSKILLPLKEYAFRKRGFYFNGILFPKDRDASAFIQGELAVAKQNGARY